MKFYKVLSCAAMSICLCTQGAAANSEDYNMALGIEERTNEIISSVLGTEKKDSDKMRYIEAAICINKVAGLSDNAVGHPLVESEKTEEKVTLWSSGDVPRRFFIGDCLNTIGFVTVFPPQHDEEINWSNPERMFFDAWYADMDSWCSRKDAVELAMNCISYDSVDYLEEAEKYGLYDSTQDNKQFITVSELKDLMIKMYKIQGGIYYPSDLDAGIITGAAYKTESYYDRYIKRMTFSRDQINIGGKNVSVMKNEFGAVLVGLREICELNGFNVTWDNGSINISYNDNEYDLKLDDFPGNIKMLTDKSMYCYHPVIVDDKWLDLDESITYLGQYEMIDDRVYVYPETFDNIIEYLSIDVENISMTFNDDNKIIEKDYSRISDRPRYYMCTGHNYYCTYEDE